MVATDRVTEIFSDAHALYESAMERLEAGDVRDAAEKAWQSTRRATGALLLSRTGQIPNNTQQVSSGIRSLGLESDALKAMRNQFAANARFLHNDCFYNGNCEPAESISNLVRETIGYIEDAQRAASR